MTYLKGIYVVRDTLAEEVGPPMTFAADAPAARLFDDLCRDPNTNVSRHVKDHELLFVGFIDARTGQLHPPTPTEPPSWAPHVVVTGAQWLLQQQAQEGK